MNIWNRARLVLRNWRYPPEKTNAKTPEAHLLAANRNIRELIEDTAIPASVREELAEEFEQISAISDKLRKSEIHIAAFGRVGVGKSSLLNALLGRDAFSMSPIHGETRAESHAEWQTLRDGNVILVDTPGIDEFEGEARSRMAETVSRRADIVLMVCESDLVQSEFAALAELTRLQRAVLLVLNKADRYTPGERSLLVERLQQRCDGMLPAGRVLTASARPAPETLVRTDEKGREVREQRERQPEISELKASLWSLAESEGQTLAALNAALFTSELDEKIATRIVSARRSVAESVLRKYCVAKGLLVAFNPVPAADLLAAAGTDIALVVHLGEIYGFRLSRSEASKLLLTISAQFIALMGAYWGVNLASSALKTASAGLSTTLTAVSQGALAWYATYLTGTMAQTWFSRGKSWGREGPKEAARRIIASLDRDALIQSARRDITSKWSRR